MEYLFDAFRKGWFAHPMQTEQLKNRVLQTITGYEKARAYFERQAESFNECNGGDRMVVTRKTRVDDNEGSGEFYEMVCLNINEAESITAEIWEIQTGW